MGMQQMQPGQHPAYLAMRPGMAPGMQGAMGMMVPPNMAAYAAMMQAQAQAQAQAAAAAEQKRRLEAAPAAAPAAKVQRTIPQQDGTPGEEDEQEDTKPEAAGGAAAGEAQQQEEEDDDPLTEDDEGSGTPQQYTCQPMHLRQPGTTGSLPRHLCAGEPPRTQSLPHAFPPCFLAGSQATT